MSAEIASWLGPTGEVAVMGIVNPTPDSFSDGGRYADPDLAVDRAQQLVAEGAAIIDVGGESTKPEASPVPREEELARVIPVIEALRGLDADISIDTMKAAVAEAAIDAGASVVNDVSALRADPEMAALCADRAVSVVLMHAGEPLHAISQPEGDLVEAVKAFLAKRVEFALAAGIPESQIVLDPGIGFGKVNPEGNLELLRRLDELLELGFPLLVGPSRKTFIGRLDGSDPHHRLGGTIAASLVAAARGARVLRVHDVAPVVQALRVAAAAA